MDMRQAIAPRSDQINSDDLIGGPRTIRITDVKIVAGEQPVSIYFEGDNGKPWRPCKSMSRVLVSAWGADASKYIGRSVTLFLDPKVKWGGIAVGGVRISHLSHMDRDMAIALTETRGKKVPFTVRVIQPSEAPTQARKQEPRQKSSADEWVRKQASAIAGAMNVDELEGIVSAESFTKALAKLAANDDGLAQDLKDAISQRFTDLQPEPTDREPGSDG